MRSKNKQGRAEKRHPALSFSVKTFLHVGLRLWLVSLLLPLFESIAICYRRIAPPILGTFFLAGI